MSPTEMMLLEALTRFGTHRDDLNAKLTTLLKNWQQGQDRHDTALANELDAMDRVFRQTLTGLADSQSAMMASVQKLTEANAQLTQALKHSMSSNQDLQAKVDTLTSVSSGLNSKIESLGSELQSLKRSLQTLSDNNQILNKSNHVLRQQQEDLNSALGSLTQELSTFKTSDASENDKPRW